MSIIVQIYAAKQLIENLRIGLSHLSRRFEWFRWHLRWHVVIRRHFEARVLYVRICQLRGHIILSLFLCLSFEGSWWNFELFFLLIDITFGR